MSIIEEESSPLEIPRIENELENFSKSIIEWEEEIYLDLSFCETNIENYGKIIIADDKMMNLEATRFSMEEMKLLPLCIFCLDGKEAIDSALEILNQALVSCPPDKKTKPIEAMLIDFQMPYKNGLEVFKTLETFYQNEPRLISATTVILTSFCTTTFQRFLREKGVEHVFEKPMNKAREKQLISILQGHK